MDTKRFFILILSLAFAVRVSAVLVMRDIHKFHGRQFGADSVEIQSTRAVCSARRGIRE